MQGEIKILVYILIGAVYLFSRFYKKEKRKQDERRINRRPTNTQTAEQIFRELQRSLRLPGTENPETEKPASEKPQRTIMQRPAIEKKPAYTYDKPIREERLAPQKTPKSSIAKKLEQQKDEKHLKAERELTLAESMEFDPRKAVIFSEILRRPYE
jgi:hypothetical protein